MHNEYEPCSCVLRAIFEVCYQRFEEVKKVAGTVTVLKSAYYSRKTEEYIADFSLISRRVLTDEEYELFKHHYLLGMDLHRVARLFNVEYENLRKRYLKPIKEKLGRAFRETEPFALYPLGHYFTDPQGRPKDVSVDVNC